ncbi:hypothetical protein [Kitasatospora sp. NPDC058218]|uniref:hypothetical protein n=1 Tax=Kitasatospora sp. NPDC058218 TaxID=3346385 RepID=UPI0036D98555
MTGSEMHLPATLRKHIVRKFEPETQAGYDLVTACKALDMGNSMHSTTVKVSNASLGVALDICREWKANSTNGNEVQTAKTVLTRHELDHEPEDPRERRHEIKFPASLAHYLSVEKARGEDPEILADLERCTWAKTNTQGRVRYATLTWMLKTAEACSIHLSGPEQRAGKKFLAAYLPAWEETGRLVAKHEKAATVTDPTPAEVDVIEDQDQDTGPEFPAAVEHEHQEQEKDQAEPPAIPRGPVPENFVFMAEHADTETARAWWARKVEQWSR